MASKFSQKIAELRRVTKLHVNWLVYATLGEFALTKDEVAELVKYDKLPMGKSLDLVDKSYLLGRLKAILKRSEYKDVTYEEVSDKSKDLKLSSLEDLVVEQARLKAGNYLKNLATEIGNGVFDALSASLGSTITEATIRDIVADETALALVQKQSSQALASSLASRLQTGPKKAWRQVAQTELHRAKVSGHAQAIINRVDIYTHSAGVNSDVSVIPAKNCCEDCSEHYLDKTGNPKVFKLLDLVSAGSNADDGVVHTKRNGKHTHWKTTLPPLHPSCGCQLVYVPPGYGWVGGKLSLLQKSLFEASLIKARAGVSGGISSTVEPKGAPSMQKTPGIPSQPGAAAPGNVAGPGRPHNDGTPPAPKNDFSPTAGIPKAGGGGGPRNDSGGSKMSKYAACPFGGGPDCMKHGGNGAEQHKMGGSIMQKHQEAMARGAQPKTEQAKEEHQKQEEARAEAYDAAPHPRDEKLSLMSEGTITSAKPLGEEGGKHVSYKATFEDGGSACMKPPPKFDEEAYEGWSFPDGAANMPRDRGHISEQAAHVAAISLGLENHVPETVVRSHDGTGGIDYSGDMSAQAWQDGYSQGTRHGIGSYKSYMARVPEEHREKVANKLKEIACMDFVINNNDRHWDNLVFNRDLSDVKAIDHGVSFGTGLQGHKNGIHNKLAVAGEKLTVPSHMHVRFKNQTFDQTKRQFEGSGLEDWQVAQVHLRMKYLAHLQDTHGHVPIEATRYAATRAKTGSDFFENQTTFLGRYRSQPNVPGWKRSTEAEYTAQYGKAPVGDQLAWWKKDKLDEQVKETTKNWEMPDQLYARFAKSYVEGGSKPDVSTKPDTAQPIKLRKIRAGLYATDDNEWEVVQDPYGPGTGWLSRHRLENHKSGEIRRTRGAALAELQDMRVHYEKPASRGSVRGLVDPGHDSPEARAELKKHAAFEAGTGHVNGGSEEERAKYWDSIPAWKPEDMKWSTSDAWSSDDVQSSSPVRTPPDIGGDVATRKPEPSGDVATRKPESDVDVHTRRPSHRRSPTPPEPSVDVETRPGRPDVDVSTRPGRVRKGLYLFDPHRAFPVDMSLRK